MPHCPLTHFEGNNMGETRCLVSTSTAPPSSGTGDQVYPISASSYMLVWRLPGYSAFQRSLDRAQPWLTLYYKITKYNWLAPPCKQETWKSAQMWRVMNTCKRTYFTYPPLTDVSQYTIASSHRMTAVTFRQGWSFTQSHMAGGGPRHSQIDCG